MPLSLVMISYSVDWISRNTSFSILRMLARGMESMVCQAMNSSPAKIRCVRHWMFWNAMSAPVMTAHSLALHSDVSARKVSIAIL